MSLSPNRILLGLSTSSVLLGLQGLQTLQQWADALGEASEESFRADRLPLLDFPTRTTREHPNPTSSPISTIATEIATENTTETKTENTTEETTMAAMTTTTSPSHTIGTSEGASNREFADGHHSEGDGEGVV